MIFGAQSSCNNEASLALGVTVLVSAKVPNIESEADRNVVRFRPCRISGCGVPARKPSLSLVADADELNKNLE